MAFVLTRPLVESEKHQEVLAARLELKEQVLQAKDSVLAGASIKEVMVRAPKAEVFQLTWSIV